MTSVARPGVDAAPTDRPTGPISLPGALLGDSTDVIVGRVAFLAVGVLAAIVDFWNLTISGYANTYYAAAAQAAALDWKAWFFGSVDPSNWITVDKPPLNTMILGLSVRLFGLSSFSILLPQALMGVASVLVLFVVVRRTFGTVAGTIAAVELALTPVAVLIFRFDNPDALLILLFVVGAWTAMRAIETGRLRWVVATAVLVGFAFNTKYLQGYMVVPAFALTWLLFAVGSLRRRVWGLVVAGVALVVSSGWWVLIVQLVPAADRPYIGGSQTNSALELLIGYDGLERIFGFFGRGGGPRGAGGGGPVGAGGAFSGDPGVLRLFNDQLAGQIAWLLPLAVVALVVGLWLRRRNPRTDPGRAAIVLWGLWLATHVVVFSLMSGIMHSYYTVAMAPAIAALVGIGVVDLWAMRTRTAWAGAVLGAAIVATAVLGAVLLARTPDFEPWIGPVAVIAALGVAAALALPDILRGWPRLAGAAVAVGLAATLLGPTAFAVDTIGTANSGGDPAAGPAGSLGGGGPAFTGGGGGRGFGGAGVGRGGRPGAPATVPGGAPPAGLPAPGSGGNPGGLPGLAPGIGGVDNTLLAYLVANRGSADWIVAVGSANESAPIQLATGQPVMAMGGFTGSDPAMTVDDLQALVTSGRLRFIMPGGFGFGFGIGRGFGPFGGDSSGVNAWITQHCAQATSIAAGLYDCASAPGTSTR